MSGGTFEGKPCKRYGHTTRYIINRGCVECDKLQQHENREYHRLYHKAWRARHNTPEWRAANNERMKRWITRNAISAHRQRIHRMAIDENTLRILYPAYTR
jgi:hypothetical protein